MVQLVKELSELAGRHAGVTLRSVRAHDGSCWNEDQDALVSA